MGFSTRTFLSVCMILLLAGCVRFPLSSKANGIHAEPKTGQPTRQVSGRNLTDPILAITPDPHLHVLSYIVMQGRKPILKLHTIYKGKMAEKGFVLPLSANVDNYISSVFTQQEAP